MNTEIRNKNYYWLNDDLYIEVYLQPGASKNAIVGLHDGELKIQITAPALENKANTHLIKFLAKHFGVAKNKVKIIRGEHSRHKLVSINNPLKGIDSIIMNN